VIRLADLKANWNTFRRMLRQLPRKRLMQMEAFFAMEEFFAKETS
jgi:hypothetical protein